MSISYQDGLKAVRHMQARGSCRSFTSQPVADDALDEIIDALLHSAAGGNLQPWSLIIERDPRRNRQLCDLCGGQPFIAQAPVNMLFLLDFHRFSAYAARQQAPFICHKTLPHVLIAIEDLMCAAQTAETAAHLLGLGSCYVGTPPYRADEIAEMYDLPKKTFPLLVLSVGHPQRQVPVAPKLDKGIMVFEGRYPNLTDDDIFDAFEAKYQGRGMDIPQNQPYQDEALARFRAALLTTFGPEEAEAIVEKARLSGRINEAQRRFGIHYHAPTMYSLGAQIIEHIRALDILPFDTLDMDK